MKLVRQHQKTVVLMVFFCMMAGVFAAGKKQTLLREPLMTPLVPHALIQQAGWTYNWQINLPIKVNEKIDRVFLHDKYLYVLTDRNILFCVDRQQGRTSVRSHTVLRRTCLSVPPIFYEGRLAFMAGNQIHVFDPSNGTTQQGEAIEQVG